MVTMEESLAALVLAGTISEAEARMRASHVDDLASRLAGGRSP
jgi:outer membrane murein-binding lipoprotein Lpp